MPDPVDLDLDSAMKSVMREAYRDEVPDVIRNEDFVVAWPEEKAALEAALASGTYTPRHPLIVEVPKSALASRPIAVIPLPDRIVYEAVMSKLAAVIDGEIVEEVHSARLRRTSKGKVTRPDQRKAWVRFQRAGRELCDKYDNVCMLTTDITSYFEFIDLDLLLRELRRVPGVEADAVDLLARVLHGFSDASSLNGVPQGPDVSSFLGNFYLRPLDAILRKLDVKFIRFQDDIKVFADEPHVLRKAVHELTPVIRGRRLNLSTAKTKLLRGAEVLEHFEDSRKDAIQYRIEIEDDSVGDELRALFDDAVAGEVNERDVRFAVYRLSKRHDDYAVPWILAHLDEVPYLSELLVRYLAENAASTPEIETRVIQFLQDERRNIDPYVEMQLIRMLASSAEVTDAAYQQLWDILLNPASDSRCRQFAARAVARHLQPSRSADLELLRGLFHRSANDGPLRRALLIALKEAGGTDKAFLDGVATGDPSLKHTARYLRGNPTLPSP